MRRHRRHRGLALSVNAVAAPASNAFENGGILIVSDVARPDFLEHRPGSTRWLARVNPADYGLLQLLVNSVTDQRGAPVFDMRWVDQSQELTPVLDQQEVTARAVIFTGVIAQTLIEVLLAAVAGIVIAAVLLELFARELVLERPPLPPRRRCRSKARCWGWPGRSSSGWWRA